MAQDRGGILHNMHLQNETRIEDIVTYNVLKELKEKKPHLFKFKDSDKYNKLYQTYGETPNNNMVLDPNFEKAILLLNSANTSIVNSSDDSVEILKNIQNLLTNNGIEITKENKDKVIALIKNIIEKNDFSLKTQTDQNNQSTTVSSQSEITTDTQQATTSTGSQSQQLTEGQSSLQATNSEDDKNTKIINILKFLNIIKQLPQAAELIAKAPTLTNHENYNITQIINIFSLLKVLKIDQETGQETEQETEQKISEAITKLSTKEKQQNTYIKNLLSLLNSIHTVLQTDKKNLNYDDVLRLLSLVNKETIDNNDDSEAGVLEKVIDKENNDILYLLQLLIVLNKRKRGDDSSVSGNAIGVSDDKSSVSGDESSVSGDVSGDKSGVSGDVSSDAIGDVSSDAIGASGNHVLNIAKEHLNPMTKSDKISIKTINNGVDNIQNEKLSILDIIVQLIYYISNIKKNDEDSKGTSSGQHGGDINDNNYKQIKKFQYNLDKDIEDIKNFFDSELSKKESDENDETNDENQKIKIEKNKNKLNDYLKNNIDKTKNSVINTLSNLKNLIDDLYKNINSSNSILSYNEDIKEYIKDLYTNLEDFDSKDDKNKIFREFEKFKSNIKSVINDYDTEIKILDIQIKKSDAEETRKHEINKAKASNKKGDFKDEIKQNLNFDSQSPTSPSQSPQSPGSSPGSPSSGTSKEGQNPPSSKEEKQKSEKNTFDEIFKTLNEIKDALKKLEENLKDFNDTSYNKNVSQFNIPSIYEDIWNEYVKLNKHLKNNKQFSIYADDALYDKIKLHNLDPSVVLKITFEDKAIFILLTFAIRLIIVIFLELLIDYNIIRTLHYSLIIYAMTYIAIIIALIITINYDSYKLRILINYLNLHINSGKIYTHIFLFILFISLVYIMIKSQDTLNNFGDLFDFTNIYKHIYEITESNKEVSDIRLSQNEKLKLQYRIDIISMIVFIFTSLLIMVL